VLQKILQAEGSAIPVHAGKQEGVTESMDQDCGSPAASDHHGGQQQSGARLGDGGGGLALQGAGIQEPQPQEQRQCPGFRAALRRSVPLGALSEATVPAGWKQRTDHGEALWRRSDRASAAAVVW
jgi:hypothetical protein